MEMENKPRDKDQKSNQHLSSDFLGDFTWHFPERSVR